MLQHRITRTARHALAVFALFTLAGCAAEPPPLPVREQAPPLDTNVYFYPTQSRAGASVEEQDRDKYECNAWAVQQTGFDPSLPNVPPHQRVRVVAQPPAGTGVAAGAITGAVLGVIVSSPRHAAGGSVIGAITGAAVGSAADAQRTAQADRIELKSSQAQTAALEQKAQSYRRAMTACLEARGYSVR